MQAYRTAFCGTDRRTVSTYQVFQKSRKPVTANAWLGRGGHDNDLPNMDQYEKWRKIFVQEYQKDYLNWMKNDCHIV